MKQTIALLAGATALLSACNNANTDAPADTATDQAAAAVTPAEAPRPGAVALGLTEARLLDADLINSTTGAELGEVAGLLRSPGGEVDRLLIEIEDSDPDRFVELPIQGLVVLHRGTSSDLVTTATAADLASLPAASPPAATPAPISTPTP